MLSGAECTTRKVVIPESATSENGLYEGHQAYILSRLRQPLREQVHMSLFLADLGLSGYD